MAFVKSLVPSCSRQVQVQPSQVVCYVKVGHRGRFKYLHLDAFTLDKNDVPDKHSQRLQFNRDRALQLYLMIREGFGFG